MNAVIDAQERRDVATIDIPNAFVQTELADDAEGNRLIAFQYNPSERKRTRLSMRKFSKV